MDIPVLFESADLLAVDKPPGVVVIPARGDDQSCLRRTLESARHEPLWVVHRIDRDTSGVVLFARNASAHRELSMAFEHHAVEKSYLALIRGALPAASGSFHTPLHTARKGKMRPALPGEPGALMCRTDYSVLKRWATALGVVCLVEARPRTGRQHQIRVHLRAAGAPLLVDPVYGRSSSIAPGELGRNVAGIDRLSLHAASLSFPSSDQGQRIEVLAPLPADMAGLVHALDELGSAEG